MARSDPPVNFDFEVGDVTRSPCRGCPEYCRFPECMETCEALDRFQRVLANMVSCGRLDAPEHYTVCRPVA